MSQNIWGGILQVELPEGAKWAIEDESGELLELCLPDKEADVKRELSLNMSTKDGKRFTVNLKTREATECLTGKSYEMKNVATEPGMLHIHVPIIQYLTELFQHLKSQNYLNRQRGFSFVAGVTATVGTYEWAAL